MSDANPKKADLVLEGGGVKGIGLLGAVLALVDAGYSFPRVAGTSAGAVVGCLVAAYQKAGRDLHGLRNVMKGLDFSKFADDSVLHRLTGPIGQGVELLLYEGAHSGSYLVDWLGAELEDAGVVTFRDLALHDPKGSLEEYQRYSVVVHASDLSRRVLARLPWDYSQYDLEASDQRVADAVRASASIQFCWRISSLRARRWAKPGVSLSK